MRRELIVFAVLALSAAALIFAARPQRSTESSQ